MLCFTELDSHLSQYRMHPFPTMSFQICSNSACSKNLSPSLGFLVAPLLLENASSHWNCFPKYHLGVLVRPICILNCSYNKWCCMPFLVISHDSLTFTVLHYRIATLSHLLTLLRLGSTSAYFCSCSFDDKNTPPPRLHLPPLSCLSSPPISSLTRLLLRPFY